MHDLLRHTDHRPFPLPNRLPWVMTQTWNDLLFAHWPLPVESLRPLVPECLEIDTYDGSAWVAVVPFHMSGIRFRGLPPIPFTTAFPEINVRTYVTVNGKPGVFFISLDATNWAAVQVANIGFHLPYFHAKMRVEGQSSHIHYQSARRGTKGVSLEFIGNYRPTSEPYFAKAGTLEHWLTERYCLYTLGADNKILRGDIHHLPWELQTAAAEIEKNTLATNQGLLLPDTPPLLHVAKKLDVLLWPLSPA